MGTERSACPTLQKKQVHAPVVILLCWERHAMQRVVGMKPLLLFQGQALQLS